VEERKRDVLWQRRLKMVKKLKTSGRLLDIGTGIGQFLFFARKQFQVVGTEISASAVKIAKEKYKQDVIKGEIENIDFMGIRFDIITVFHVLEHLTNPLSFMERCKELLSDEGVIIIAVPNDINSLLQRLRHLLHRAYDLPKLALDNSQHEIHLSHFTCETLRNWLTTSDFVIIQETLDPYYAAIGRDKIIQDLRYSLFLVLQKFSGMNLYNTIWVAAKIRKSKV
jgi:2-polyprenyl-3-methyl-5-hydroxy-6-metoxy-1,4-benzoquinol methylase